MNVIDLFLDNVEHVASLVRRPHWTRLPLWTTHTAVTDLPRWSSRPPRTPIVARTIFPLGHRCPVCSQISMPKTPKGHKHSVNAALKEEGAASVRPRATRATGVRDDHLPDRRHSVVPG